MHNTKCNSIPVPGSTQISVRGEPQSSVQASRIWAGCSGQSFSFCFSFCFSLSLWTLKRLEQGSRAAKASDDALVRSTSGNTAQKRGGEYRREFASPGLIEAERPLNGLVHVSRTYPSTIKRVASSSLRQEIQFPRFVLCLCCASAVWSLG